MLKRFPMALSAIALIVLLGGCSAISELREDEDKGLTPMATEPDDLFWDRITVFPAFDCSSGVCKLVEINVEEVDYE